MGKETSEGNKGQLRFGKQRLIMQCQTTGKVLQIFLLDHPEDLKMVADPVWAEVAGVYRKFQFNDLSPTVH